ncbi:MAG: DUF1684 domain-containing protein [Proteobacteria bacterium]|nr:DUF1684 domain-containing protein [Pseudomonadota bacterium]
MVNSSPKLLPARFAALGLCGLLSACSGGERETGVSSEAQSPAELAAFQADQQHWREQRAAELTRPDGWTSLVGLHWIGPGAHHLGSDTDNGIRLAVGPEHLGMIELNAGATRFVPERGVAVTLDGARLTGPVELRADDAAGGPSVLGFDDGRGLATVIKRGACHALRVKHADAPRRVGFGGLDYWPARREWRVAGQFVEHPPGKTLPIANIIGTIEQVANPGVVEFEHDGTLHRIEALDHGEDTLFLVFADRTSGHGSYGAGRYLDAPRPDAQGRITLDFNRAYNPPCAFTAFATCPLPPPENRLDLAIEAGEKTYASPH